MGLGDKRTQSLFSDFVIRAPLTILSIGITLSVWKQGEIVEVGDNNNIVDIISYYIDNNK